MRHVANEGLVSTLAVVLRYMKIPLVCDARKACRTASQRINEFGDMQRQRSDVLEVEWEDNVLTIFYLQSRGSLRTLEGANQKFTCWPASVLARSCSMTLFFVERRYCRYRDLCEEGVAIENFLTSGPHTSLHILSFENRKHQSRLTRQLDTKSDGAKKLAIVERISLPSV